MLTFIIADGLSSIDNTASLLPLLPLHGRIDHIITTAARARRSYYMNNSLDSFNWLASGSINTTTNCPDSILAVAVTSIWNATFLSQA